MNPFPVLSGHYIIYKDDDNTRIPQEHECDVPAVGFLGTHWGLGPCGCQRTPAWIHNGEIVSTVTKTLISIY